MASNWTWTGVGFVLFFWGGCTSASEHQSKFCSPVGAPPMASWLDVLSASKISSGTVSLSGHLRGGGGAPSKGAAMKLLDHHSLFSCLSSVTEINPECGVPRSEQSQHFSLLPSGRASVDTHESDTIEKKRKEQNKNRRHCWHLATVADVHLSSLEQTA